MYGNTIYVLGNTVIEGFAIVLNRREKRKHLRYKYFCDLSLRINSFPTFHEEKFCLSITSS